MAKKDDGHRMGKSTGYTVRDGDYYPAPTYVDGMNDIAARRNGLNEYISAVNKHLIEASQDLAEDQQRWWKNLCEDLGIDPSEPWQYSFGRVFKKAKEEPKESA